MMSPRRRERRKESKAVSDPIRRWARETPEAPAVVGLAEEEGSPPPVWTYQELDRWISFVARALVAAGVPPGGRVGVRLPPSPEAIVLFHAVMRAGGIFVPLNASWTEAEIARGLAATGFPSLIVSTLGEVVEWDGEGPPMEDAVRTTFPAIAPDNPSAILLTSGSTGAPRPITLTHRNLRASSDGAIRRLGLNAGDCWLSSLSPGHVGGLALLYRAAVVGCSVLARPRFDAYEAAGLIESGAVSHLSLVPVMLERLLAVRGDRAVPETLRCVLMGGDRLPGALLERSLGLGYPIALTYGMTEATSQIATAEPEKVRRKPGSVGQALDEIEVRIADPDPEGVGEILVRGPVVVDRLPVRDGRRRLDGLGEPSPSSDSPPSVFIDPEGWLHTGDLGRLDDEGDLEVLGRLTDRIVTAGVTVEPAEVEEVLARHPKVQEVAVVGVADDEWGERILAGVVPRDPLDPPTLEDLIDFARERLAPAKRPRELRLLTDLPRNERGKVIRSRLTDA